MVRDFPGCPVVTPSLTLIESSTDLTPMVMTCLEHFSTRQKKHKVKETGDIC